MSFEKDLGVDATDGTDSTAAPDISHGGGSRIADQDRRVEDQRLPAPNTPTLTPTPGYEGGSASECRRL